MSFTFFEMQIYEFFCVWWNCMSLKGGLFMKFLDRNPIKSVNRNKIVK